MFIKLINLCKKKQKIIKFQQTNQKSINKTETIGTNLKLSLKKNNENKKDVGKKRTS
jgi:hypothetical protein